MKNFIKIFTCIFLFSNIAVADDVKEVKDFVNNFGNKMITIASATSTTVDQKRDEMVKLIDSIVDSEWVAKFVLANDYKSASEKQKERFRSLYHEFMIHTYAPSFKGYNGENFKVMDAVQQGKYFMVKCLFIRKDSSKVNVAFRLKRNKDGSSFSILDVIAEGVSLIETQRAEFGATIANKGLDGFFDDLELKVKELKKANKLKK